MYHGLGPRRSLNISFLFIRDYKWYCCKSYQNILLIYFYINRITNALKASNKIVTMSYLFYVFFWQYDATNRQSTVTQVAVMWYCTLLYCRLENGFSIQRNIEKKLLHHVLIYIINSLLIDNILFYRCVRLHVVQTEGTGSGQEETGNGSSAPCHAWNQDPNTIKRRKGLKVASTYYAIYVRISEKILPFCLA